MTVADAILQPYVDAPTLPEAEAELDRLAGRNAELPVPLGDLYDELAEAAANDHEYEQAARLEAKAIEAGCRDPFVARWLPRSGGASARRSPSLGSSVRPSGSTSGSSSTRTTAAPPRPSRREEFRSHGPWPGSRPISERPPSRTGPTSPTISPTLT